MKYDLKEHKRNFESAYDYESHLKQLLNSDEWDLIGPEIEGDQGFIERTFLHRETSEYWQLVEPDPPFRGRWCKLAIQEHKLSRL